LGLRVHNASLRIFYQVNCAAAAFFPEAMAKPDFTVILNEVKDLKSLKIRDSSLRAE
jgi:hypothetical protein